MATIYCPPHCGTCRHAHKKGAHLSCRRYPPSGHMLAVTHNLTGEQTMQTVGVYPPVAEVKDWCSEWSPTSDGN